ncbi:hypothetical protein BD779DRAFT_1210341 [Infundibulicybe gibba]|nr:hypothetical protein BD779DRAFT_1210341 [Infundibulicybe gibba]
MEKSLKSLRNTSRPTQLSQWFLGAFVAVGVLWLSDLHDKYHVYFNRYTVCSSSKNIYTVDELNPRVECLSVTGNRISAVGSRHTIAIMEGESKLLRYLTPTRRVIHLDPDAIVVPGLAGRHLLDDEGDLELFI